MLKSRLRRLFDCYLIAVQPGDPCKMSDIPRVARGRGKERTLLGVPKKEHHEGWHGKKDLGLGQMQGISELEEHLQFRLVSCPQ